MNILIVDDESLARDRLRQLLSEIPDCQVCAEAATGVEALDACNRSAPDVVLLDIRMPDMDGLEAARHLCNLEKPPAIVFTTAYSDHALAAFDAQAVDYLLKPIRKDRLGEALVRAQRISRALTDQLAQTVAPEARRHICARVRGDLVLVPFADVRCFLADSKYVSVEHTGGQVLIEESLKSIESEFGERILRVHRNALVVREHILALEKAADGTLRVRLQGVTATPEVSRRHASEIRQLLKAGR